MHTRNNWVKEWGGGQFMDNVCEVEGDNIGNNIGTYRDVSGRVLGLSLKGRRSRCGLMGFCVRKFFTLDNYILVGINKTVFTSCCTSTTRQ